MSLRSNVSHMNSSPFKQISMRSDRSPRPLNNVQHLSINQSIDTEDKAVRAKTQAMTPMRKITVMNDFLDSNVDQKAKKRK